MSIGTVTQMFNFQEKRNITHELVSQHFRIVSDTLSSVADPDDF
jgi:hypothetical protein